MPNLFFAIQARKKKVDGWRKTPEYRAASDAWLLKNPWCEVWLAVGVKVKATEIHHPNKWSYASFELYVDFENNGAMAVSGSRNGGGHYACHHGLKVCPICKKKKCDQFAEGCQSCLKEKYPALVVLLEKVKRDRLDRKNAKRRKNPHPCKSHRAKGTCGKSMLNMQCPHAARKAESCCDEFERRVKAA